MQWQACVLETASLGSVAGQILEGQCITLKGQHWHEVARAAHRTSTSKLFQRVGCASHPWVLMTRIGLEVRLEQRDLGADAKLEALPAGRNGLMRWGDVVRDAQREPMRDDSPDLFHGGRGSFLHTRTRRSQYQAPVRRNGMRRVPKREDPDGSCLHFFITASRKVKVRV